MKKTNTEWREGKESNVLSLSTVNSSTVFHERVVINSTILWTIVKHVQNNCFCFSTLIKQKNNRRPKLFIVRKMLLCTVILFTVYRLGLMIYLSESSRMYCKNLCCFSVTRKYWTPFTAPSGRVWSRVTCLFSAAAGPQHWAGSCRSECRPACERALRTEYHPPPAPASALQTSSYGHAELWKNTKISPGLWYIYNIHRIHLLLLVLESKCTWNDLLERHF